VYARGNIKKEETKDFTVSVENPLVEVGSTITVTKTGSTIMKDQNGSGTKELPFTLAQAGGLFTFTAENLVDGEQSILSSVSCDSANLQATGSYKGPLIV